MGGPFGPPRRDGVAEALRVARSPALRGSAGLLSIAAACLGLALGIAVGRTIRLEPYDSHGVIGWVAAHGYPKQQDILYFAGAVVGLPVFVAASWGVWLLVSARIARRISAPVASVLRGTAAATAPLLAACGLVQRTGLDSTRLVVVLAIATLIAEVAVVAFLAHRPDRSPSAPEPAPGDPRPTWSEPARHRFAGPKRIVTVGLIPVALYALYTPDVPNNAIDLFEEGHCLTLVAEMERGKVPFRDLYIQHGFLEDVGVPFLGFRLFGPTLWGIRKIRTLVEPLGYVALYFLAREVLGSGPLGALVVVIFSSGVGFWVPSRNLLGIVSVALVAGDLGRQRGLDAASSEECARMGAMRIASGLSARLLLAGAAAGLAFWHSTEVGIYSLGGIALFLALDATLVRGSRHPHGLRGLASFALGAGIGLLAVGAPLIMSGAFGRVVENTHIQCATQLGAWGLPFPPIAEALEPMKPRKVLGLGLAPPPREFPFYLPIVTLVVSAAYLAHRWLRGSIASSGACRKLLLVTIVACAFFRTALGRSDEPHLVSGSTFVWLILVLFVERGGARLVRVYRDSRGGRRARLREAVAASWALAPAAVVLWFGMKILTPFEALEQRVIRRESAMGEGPVPTHEFEGVGRLSLPERQVQRLRPLIQYIRQDTSADETIFDFTNQAALYFLADRPNPTRFTHACLAPTPDLQREIIGGLESHRTRLVLYQSGHTGCDVDGLSNEARLPLVAAYLAEHYEPAENINGAVLLRRIEPRSRPG